MNNFTETDHTSPPRPKPSLPTLPQFVGVASTPTENGSVRALELLAQRVVRGTGLALARQERRVPVAVPHRAPLVEVQPLDALRRARELEDPLDRLGLALEAPAVG